jgi:hypothetical protein
MDIITLLESEAMKLPKGQNKINVDLKLLAVKMVDKAMECSAEDFDAISR